MPNRFDGWTHRDLINFLKHHGFYWYEARKGSHEAWISYDNRFVVEINIPKGSYVKRTLDTMIKQSGIHQDEYLKWAITGGKCCQGFRKREELSEEDLISQYRFQPAIVEEKTLLEPEEPRKI